MHSKITDLWPASGVAVRSDDLELRWMDDELLVELADLAGRGIHDANSMPFNFPWSRGTAIEVARSVLTYQWAARGQIAPLGEFALELAVLVGGKPVGIQGASGENWRIVRTAETGSWLGREFQGRGIGTRMRAAIVWALFEGLGADRVTSGAFIDNAPSAAVSRRLGYEPNGEKVVAREGVQAVQTGFLLRRDRWEVVKGEHERLLGGPVELQGFDALRRELD